MNHGSLKNVIGSAASWKSENIYQGTVDVISSWFTTLLDQEWMRYSCVSLAKNWLFLIVDSL